MRLGDLGQQPLGEHGDAVLEGLDGFLEAADVGLGMGEELIEEDGQFVGVAEVGAEGRLLVLIEDSAAGVFEDGVGERIAAAEVVAVPEGAIGADEAVAGAQGLLTDQFPAYEAARALEEILERGAECRLVLDVPGAVPLKLLVVAADQGMGGRDVEGARHSRLRIWYCIRGAACVRHCGR